MHAILFKIGYPVRLLTYDDLGDSIDTILSQLVEARKNKGAIEENQT